MATAVFPVTKNQLALPAPDGDERVDDLDTGLQRYSDRCAIHDGRRGALNGQPRGRDHGPQAVEWAAQWIDDTPQQGIPDPHIHDAPGAFHFIARVQLRIVPQQHNADLVFVDIERDAGNPAGKGEQLLESHAGQPGDPGDASGDARDRADLPRRQLRFEGFPRVADPGKGAIKNAPQSVGRRAHAFAGASSCAAALWFIALR